jgi:hypothetical protein
VPRDGRIAIITPTAKRQLLASIRVVSKDFVTAAALESGTIDHYMGFKIVECNLIPLHSGTLEYSFFGHPSGLIWGIRDLRTVIERVPSRDSEQVLYKFYFAAARVQEEFFVRAIVDSAETTVEQ